MVLFTVSIVAGRAAINEPFLWLNPLPTGNSLVTAAYGAGTYIACDNNGNIFESTNTIDWSVRTNVASVPVSSCYGSSAFVTVGKKGVILAGLDGHWSTATSPTTSDLNQVIFVNGSFWAVGANGTILSSTDGLSWTAHTSGTTLNLYSISYGNGTFVIVSGNTSFTSADGSNWAAHTDTSGYNGTYLRVAFGNGKFFKVGYHSIQIGGPISGTSTDGVTWSNKTTTGSYTPARLIFAQGYFVMIDGMGSGYIGLYDGSGNFSTTISVPAPMNDVVAGDTNLLVVGNLGATGTSTNSLNWSFRSSPNATCSGIARSSDAVVAIVGDPYNAFGNSVPILTSTNGSPFFASGSAVHAINDIIYTNGSFVAVGFNGVITKSTDAVSWTPRSTGVSTTLNSITYGGVFVSVGTGGTIITSSTGDAWTPRFTGITASLNSITYGAGSYVAVGDGGTVLTSSDSVSWTGQYSTVTNNILGIAYGNGTFVAFCDNGKVLKSADAINWTAQIQTTPALAWRIVFDGYQFICPCPSSTVITSLDGVSWVSHVFNASSNFKGVCAASDGLLICGDGGKIIHSGTLREPRIASAKFSSVPFTFDVQGEMNHAYTLQTSTDLSAWTTVSTFTNNSPVTQTSDTSSPPAATRFYRVTTSSAP